MPHEKNRQGKETFFTRQPRLIVGAASVVGMALLFAAFDVWLYLDGHQPSFTGNGIGAEHYYLWQAVFLTPLMFIGWLLFGGVAHATAQKLGDGDGDLSATAARLGRFYGASIGLLYVLPDIIAYAIGGFDALAPVMKVTTPLCFFALVTLSTWSVHASHEISWPGAVVSVFSGLIVQGVAVTPWLR